MTFCYKQSLAIAFCIAAHLPAHANPQTFDVIGCGEILIGKIFAKDGDRHHFSINMEAGESFILTVNPTGNYLRVRAKVRDSSGAEICDSVTQDDNTNKASRGSQRVARAQTETLSHTGEYKVTLTNRGIGEYALSVGCIERDGTEIGPHKKIYARNRNPRQ